MESVTLYNAWVDASDTVFDPSAHRRMDLRITNFQIMQSEGEVAIATLTVENPGIGMLAPGRQQHIIISVSEDGADPVPIFRGIVNSMPSNLAATQVELEFYGAPSDQEERLKDYAKPLFVRPYAEPLISGTDMRDPTSVLQARSANFYVDPVTHEISLSDIIDPVRVIDVGPMIVRESLEPSMAQPPIRKAKMNFVAEWTQTAFGTCDIAQQVNFYGPNHLNGSDLDTSILSLTDVSSFGSEGEIRTPDGTTGWSIVNVELEGATELHTARKFKTGNYEIVVMKKRVGTDASGEPIYRYYDDTRYEIQPMYMYRYRPAKFELTYDFQQPRREILTVELEADIQDIQAFGWKEEDLDDIGLGSLREDGTTPVWEENTDYVVGDKVSYRDKVWICQLDHNSGYDRFKRLLPQFENVPQALRTLDMYYWKQTDKDVPLKDERAFSFINTDRGREVVEHAVLRVRAFLRNRMRCMTVKFRGRWQDLSGVTLKDAVRIEHDFFPSGECTGKVTSFTKYWDGPSQDWYVDVVIGVCAGKGVTPLPAPSGGTPYSEAFGSYAWVDDSDLVHAVDDLQFQISGDKVSWTVNPYKLSSGAYSCLAVNFDMLADQQIPIASAAEASGRSPWKAVESHPTSFELVMRPISSKDVITRKMLVTGTKVQGPRGIDLEYSS